MRSNFDNFGGRLRLRSRLAAQCVSARGRRKDPGNELTVCTGAGDWRPLDARRRRFARVFLRLLAQRGHFEPRAGGHDQHFQRRGVEHAIGAAIGVEQGGNFIFQYQRQNHDLFVLGSTKLFDEAADPSRRCSRGPPRDSDRRGDRAGWSCRERKSFIASSSPKPRPCHPVAAPAFTTKSATRAQYELPASSKARRISFCVVPA